MKYIAKINLSNKNNSHTLAFDLIQSVAEGKRLEILEVGCSAGYFGSALREVGHTVRGVEPNHDAVIVAHTLLDSVFEGFIQDYFIQHPDSYFDVIVFGDVLEHLPDPQEVLALCRSHLRDGGAIVASVPNVAHLSVRAMLLEGRWDYSELGILDHTHLRFFTRTTLIKLFSDSAYRVLRLHPVRISAEQVDEMCGLNLDAKALKAAQLHAKDDRVFDFQYVLLAKPVAEIEMALEYNALIDNDGGPRIVCLTPSLDSTLTELRIRTPLERWALQNGGNIKLISIYDHTDSDLEWGDIFIFQRDANEYVLRLIKFLKFNGKKVIFEIDDLLTDLPPFLSHHAESVSANRTFLIDSLRLSDAVTVTTIRLGNQLSCYNKNIHCIPNCAEQSQYRTAIHNEVEPSEVTLILASSDKVLVDFIVPALRLAQEKLSVKIVAIGPPGEYLANAGLNIRRVGNMPYADFRAFVASIDNGIGLIPLDDSLFSSCKSPIKFFDYSLAGIPSICSNVSPYAEHIVNEESGFLVENETESIYYAIEYLALSHSARTKVSKNAFNYVVNNFSSRVSADAWQNLIAKLIPNVSLTRKKIRNINFTPPASKILVFWMLEKIVSPVAYQKAFRTFRSHGLKGLVNRIRRR